MFEEFSSSNFKHDFNFNFGGEDDDFYAEVNLKDRVIRVEIPTEESYDETTGHGRAGSWYVPEKEIEALVKGENGHLIEHLNTHLVDCYENHTIPEHILIDEDEEIEKLNDNTFLAKLKVKKESYNNWVIKNKAVGWSKRTGKKYGI